MSSVRPPGGVPAAMMLAVPFGPHPRSKAQALASEGTPEGRAANAETQSRERVDRAEQAASDAEAEINERLDRVRDDYQRESEMESVRNETAITAQKTKGYEQLRDLQRAQEAELAKVKREGEKELARLSSYYRDQTHATEVKGRDDLTEIKHQVFSEAEAERRGSMMSTDELRTEHAQQLQTLKDETDANYERISQSVRGEYDRMAQNATESRLTSEARFQKQAQGLHDAEAEKIAELESAAASKLTDLRADLAAKLSAYSTRQKDPFYKLINVDASLEDVGDAYVLHATIPVHEQGHVSVVVKGDNLVLAGYRRNEEKIERDDGHVQGTSSYQSYSENFPLPWPVEGHQLTRSFDGDELTVRLPKKNRFAKASPPPSPERARLDRPKFPDNLPYVEPEKAPDPDSPPSSPAGRSRGGRTLALG
jgi:HSP20 family molecular chaperone IbpA